MSTQLRFKPKNGFDANSINITNVSTPLSPTDAANSAYVLSQIAAISVTNRASVRPSLLLDFSNSKTLDPRITFSRSGAGAYYDGQTTALAEQNLCISSQAFGNATWGNGGTSMTAVDNSGIAPDGTTTAALATCSAGTLVQHSLAQNSFLVQGNTYMFSIYLKAGTYGYVGIGLNSTSNSIAVNLATGAIVTGSGTVTASTNGFYRVSALVTAGGAKGVYINPTDSLGNTSFTTVGTENFYLWGAQVEQRASATAYNPTTTTPINNYIPVLMFAASNVPRFDINPNTNESLGLLMEQGSTNMLSYSQSFSGGGWIINGPTIVSASDVAPDGTLTACTMREGTTSSAYFKQYNLAGTFASGSSYTISQYVKQVSYPLHALELMDYTNNAGTRTVFNLATGTISSAGVTNGNFIYVGSTITPVGNGWYRITLTGTLGALGSSLLLFQDFMNGYTTYTGNGYNSTLVWGAQLEACPFATSYIPTTTAAVTRGADAAAMTGVNFSSWYNYSQGTLYTEGNVIGVASFSCQVSINNGSGNYEVYLSTNNVGYSGVVPGTTVYVNGGINYSPNLISQVSPIGSYGKLAVSLSTSVLGAFNGYVSAPVTNVIESNLMNRMDIGSRYNGGSTFSGHIKRIAYYPVALPSSQLQGVTAQ